MDICTLHACWTAPVHTSQLGSHSVDKTNLSQAAFILATALDMTWDEEDDDGLKRYCRWTTLNKRTFEAEFYIRQLKRERERESEPGYSRFSEPGYVLFEDNAPHGAPDGKRPPQFIGFCAKTMW